MTIRKATRSDLDKILQIYSYAREQMRKNGNPTQWKNSYPSISVILRDIENEDCYVIENDGEICGVFTFAIGDDPTYRIIDGKWKNDDCYGAIHRVASLGTARGILKNCLDFCSNYIQNIRMDTHNDNLIMQHLLEKYGFERCGTVFAEDGSPRIAYQRDTRK